MARALEMDPISMLLDSALPPKAKLAAVRCVNEPAMVISQRNKALRTLKKISDSLAPLRTRWAQALPEGSPARRLNLPLFHFITETLEYEDTTLVKELMRGMPIVGSVPSTNVLTERVRPAQSTQQEWRSNLPARNKEVWERTIRSQGPELANECWRKTLLDVEAGWASMPTPVTNLDLTSTSLTPRYAIKDANGGEIRLIDDFRAIAVNELVSTADTEIPDTLDAALALETLFEKLSPELELNSFAVDFRHAYKNIPLPTSQHELATIILAPPDGPPMKAVLKTQPFGAKRAPANWARVTAFLRWVVARLFSITLFVYVDDCFTVEPVSTVLSAFKSIQELFALFGLELEEDKEKKPTKELELLGAQILFAPGMIKATLPVNKRLKYTTELRAILARNALGPAEAAKIRGKLGYAQTLFFGRVGRSLLRPFSVRQYDSAASSSTKLPQGLKDVIPWWIAQLGCAKPRMVCTRPTHPVLAYSDACGEGHLGAITVLDGMVATHHTHVPSWFARAKTGIFELELMACVIGLLAAMAIAPGRPVLLCCDNMGARGTIMRGTCGAAIGRMISSVFWNIAAQFECAVWIEFAPSALNSADPPSRSCPLLPDNTRTEVVSEGVPELFTHILKSRQALAEAQYQIPQGGLNKATGWPRPEHQESRDPAE